MSPTSPTKHRSHKPSAPPGFLPAPRPKKLPVKEMSIRELQDQHNRNAEILSKPAPSTSTYVQRLSAEQTTIEARLVELGVDTIKDMMQEATIHDRQEEEDNEMKTDDGPPSPSVPKSRAIDTKRRILARYSARIQPTHEDASSFSFDEAVRIEQEAHAADLLRKQHIEEKKRRLGLPIKGEVLSQQEREKRIWAFMNYKPSDSDLEDDSDDLNDDSDDDPAAWFEDDQDDGRKGQDIIEPDYEDLTSVIRIDDSRIPRSMFYEPKDDD
ncbi:hypothetical protein QCA50_000139 [Cerrena zonata]|uniref:Uncharacterized protein n=1 Tax=Cerrena zonata TaxID=2478898 RepID=A0AAW0GPH5_9APHY